MMRCEMFTWGRKVYSRTCVAGPLILKMAAELRVPMPATAATFQINTAAAAESSEEGFLAVIRLAENLSRVNTHQNGRDNLQSSKLEIRNSKQIQMTKLKENSKRASLDAVFWIFPFEIYSTRMFVSDPSIRLRTGFDIRVWDF